MKNSSLKSTIGNTVPNSSRPFLLKNYSPNMYFRKVPLFWLSALGFADSELISGSSLHTICKGRTKRWGRLKRKTEQGMWTLKNELARANLKDDRVWMKWISLPRARELMRICLQIWNRCRAQKVRGWPRFLHCCNKERRTMDRIYFPRAKIGPQPKDK